MAIFPALQKLTHMKMFHCIDDRQTRNKYFQRTFQSDISKTLESQCPKKNHVTISENWSLWLNSGFPPCQPSNPELVQELESKTSFQHTWS